jgi:hypothetical protein
MKGPLIQDWTQNQPHRPTCVLIQTPFCFTSVLLVSPSIFCPVFSIHLRLVGGLNLKTSHFSDHPPVFLVDNKHYSMGDGCHITGNLLSTQKYWEKKLMQLVGIWCFELTVIYPCNIANHLLPIADHQPLDHHHPWHEFLPISGPSRLYLGPRATCR